MVIHTDNEIFNKCLDEVNKFHNKYKVRPNIICMNLDQFRDLWLYTLYTLTFSDLSKPHTLTNIFGCEIEIRLTQNIYCEYRTNI